MKGEIVTATTADQVRLHGFFRESEMPDASPTVLLVHGLSGNFYSSRLLNYCSDRCVQAGWNSLNINTRGHDLLNTVSQRGGATHIGAVFERVADCVYDLAAWVDWIENRVNGPIWLIGHSLGAIKSLYWQAHQRDSRIDQMAVLSATRLNHENLLASPKGQRFEELISLAKQKVDNNRTDEILTVDFPFPTWMAAGAYYEKYGPDSRYDWFQFVDRVELPTLFVFGQRELDNHPAFEGLASLLDDRIANLPNITSTIVDNANHFYVGQLEPAWDVIERWFRAGH